MIAREPTQLSLAERQRQQQQQLVETPFSTTHPGTGTAAAPPPLAAEGRVAIVTAPSLLASQPATCCLENVLPIAVSAPLLRDLLCLEAALLGCPEAQGLSALRGALVRCKTKGSYTWQQIRGVAQTDGEWMLTVGQGRQLSLVHPKFVSSSPKNKIQAGVDAELQELSTRWPAMLSSRQQVAEIQWALEGATSQLHKILERKQLTLGAGCVPVSSAALGALIETLRMPDGPPFRLLFVQPVSVEEAAAAAAAVAAMAASGAQAVTMPATVLGSAPAAAPTALPHLPPGFDGSQTLAAPASAAPLPPPPQQQQQRQQQQQQAQAASALVAPLPFGFDARHAAPAAALQPQQPAASLELPPRFASRKSAAAPPQQQPLQFQPDRQPQKMQHQLGLQHAAESQLPPGFAPTQAATTASRQELSVRGPLMPPGIEACKPAPHSMPVHQQMPAISLPMQLQAGAEAGASIAALPSKASTGRAGALPAVGGSHAGQQGVGATGATAPDPNHASSAAAAAAAGVASLAAAAQAIQQVSSSFGGLSAPSLLLGIKADLERLLAAAGAGLGGSQPQSLDTATGKQQPATMMLQEAASGAVAGAAGPTSSGGSGTGGWPAVALQAEPAIGGSGAIPAGPAGAAGRVQHLGSMPSPGTQVRPAAESGSPQRQSADGKGSLGQQQGVPARQAGGSDGRGQQRSESQLRLQQRHQQQRRETQEHPQHPQQQQQHDCQQQQQQQQLLHRSLSEEGEIPPESLSQRPSSPPSRNRPSQQLTKGTLSVTIINEGACYQSRQQQERHDRANERAGRSRSRRRSRDDSSGSRRRGRVRSRSRSRSPIRRRSSRGRRPGTRSRSRSRRRSSSRDRHLGSRWTRRSRSRSKHSSRSRSRSRRHSRSRHRASSRSRSRQRRSIDPSGGEASRPIDQLPAAMCQAVELLCERSGAVLPLSAFNNRVVLRIKDMFGSCTRQMLAWLDDLETQLPMEPLKNPSPWIMGCTGKQHIRERSLSKHAEQHQRPQRKQGLQQEEERLPIRHLPQRVQRALHALCDSTHGNLPAACFDLEVVSNMLELGGEEAQLKFVAYLVKQYRPGILRTPAAWVMNRLRTRLGY